MQYPDVLFWATPNGAWLAGNDRQRFGQINKLRAEGLTPGVPDLIIAEARGSYNACAVEMKSEKGKLSVEQSEILHDLMERGWYTIIAYGFDQAKEQITKYLDVTV